MDLDDNSSCQPNRKGFADVLRFEGSSHKGTDGVYLVVYQLSQGLHRLQKTLISHKMNAVCSLVKIYLQSTVPQVEIRYTQQTRKNSPFLPCEIFLQYINFFWNLEHKVHMAMWKTYMLSIYSAFWAFCNPTTFMVLQHIGGQGMMQVPWVLILAFIFGTCPCRWCDVLPYLLLSVCIHVYMHLWPCITSSMKSYHETVGMQNAQKWLYCSEQHAGLIC